MIRAAAFALLVFGCAQKGTEGPAGPSGPSGPDGPPGPTGAPGSSSPTCTANALFCSGAKLARCSASGLDAMILDDCTGTATNPGACGTTNCLGKSACCGRKHPVLEWNLTNPATTGQVFTADPDRTFEIGRVCDAGTNLALGSLKFSTGSAICPSIGFSLTLDRSAVKPLDTITLPNQGVVLTATVGSVPCSSWMGTVTLNGDLPGWSVTFDVRCTEAGRTMAALAGSVSGND